MHVVCRLGPSVNKVSGNHHYTGKNEGADINIRLMHTVETHKHGSTACNNSKNEPQKNIRVSASNKTEQNDGSSEKEDPPAPISLGDTVVFYADADSNRKKTKPSLAKEVLNLLFICKVRAQGHLPYFLRAKKTTSNTKLLFYKL